MTTLVKINIDDKDTVAMMAAEFGIPCRFFTIETNEGLLQAEFDTESPASLFHLGKAIGHKITNDEWYNGMQKVMK